jgi:hypothetical protein
MCEKVVSDKCCHYGRQTQKRQEKTCFKVIRGEVWSGQWAVDGGQWAVGGGGEVRWYLHNFRTVKLRIPCNPAGLSCGSFGFLLLHERTKTHALGRLICLRQISRPRNSVMIRSCSKKPETSAGQACGIQISGVNVCFVQLPAGKGSRRASESATTLPSQCAQRRTVPAQSSSPRDRLPRTS